MTKEKLEKLQLVFFIISGILLDPYDDEIYEKENFLDYDQQIEECKFYMNLALIKLINEGCSEEELLEMIDDIEIIGLKDLSEIKQKYIKEESKKLIMKRKEKFIYE